MMDEKNRKDVLLKAAYDLLEKCDYALDETVTYDGTECDGHCLLVDIAIELEIEDEQN